MGACACAVKNTSQKYQANQINADDVNQIREEVQAAVEANHIKETISVKHSSLKEILTAKEKTNAQSVQEDSYHQCFSLASNTTRPLKKKKKTVSYNSNISTIYNNSGSINNSSYLTELEEKQSNSQTELQQQSDLKIPDFQKQTSKLRNSNFNHSSMLGQGMSPQDNAIIQQSLNFQSPIKLQAIDLKVGVTYHGQWMNAMRHGYGIQVWEDGSRFQGQWEYNQMNGNGTLHYYDGDVYEGEWRDDVFYGYGKYSCANGHFYEGKWLDGKKNGKGHQIWEEGEEYIGEFKDGLKHGRGNMKYKDGSYYEGQFASNQINGRGKYVWITSRQYDGEWSRNKMSGFGILKWNDGRYYKGQFIADKRHGKGEMHYIDGTRYVGNWFNGKQSGHGQIYEGVKLKFVGQWKDGKKIKKNQKHEQTSNFSR